MSTSNLFSGREWRDFVRLLWRARAVLRSPGSGAAWSDSLDDQARNLGYRWQNWAGNQHAKPTDWPRTETKEEVKSVVVWARNNGKKVRVLGGGYSFSPLVPTNDVMLDLTCMNSYSVDKQNKTITAGPGTTIAQLHSALVQKKLCLETAPVIPWITVGGALGTGVHGTGKDYDTLADLVVEAQVVDGHGKCHTVKGPKSNQLTDEGRALGCNLGALGVITSVTFQAVDLFNLEVKDDTRNYWLETTMLCPTGLRSLLTDENVRYVSALWWPGTERCWVKKWKRTDKQPTKFHVQYLLDQLGIWLGADPVTALGKVLAAHPEWTPIFTALVFDEIQHQEYVSPAPDVFHFITRYPKVWDMQYAFDLGGCSDTGIGRVVDAWKALVRILEDYRSQGLFPQNMAAHMRHIQSSSSLLSPATGHKGSVTLEIVTLQGQCDGVWTRFFREVEAAWMGLGGRPHWGKLHAWGAGGDPFDPTQLAKILKLYPSSNVTTFRKVRHDWDPDHLFQNPYVAALPL